MAQPVVHFEFWSENPTVAADFFRQAFEWDIQHFEPLDYHLVNPTPERGIGGGIMQPKDPWPAKLTLYIEVDDIATARDRIIQAGGTILVEFREVAGVGEFCMFEDPDGRVLGIWKELAETGSAEC